MKERDWGRILEITFWALAIGWLLLPLFTGDPDVPLKTKFYYHLSRGCYTAAAFLGELGMQAETAYWEVVRELHA